MQYYQVCLTEVRELWYYIEAEDGDSAIDMVEADYEEDAEPDEEIISVTKKAAYEMSQY
jgi:hypothetical protein